MEWIKASSLKDIKFKQVYFAKLFEGSNSEVKSTGWFQESDGTFFWDNQGYVPILKKDWDHLFVLDESTPAIPEDVEQAAIRYVRENGHPNYSNNLLNFELQDSAGERLLKAFLAGAAHIQKQKDKELKIVLNDMNTLAEMQSEAMGRVVEKAKQIKQLEETIQELELAIKVRDAMLNSAGLSHSELDEKEAKQKLAKDLTTLKSSAPIPSSIVRRLEEANPYPETKGFSAHEIYKTACIKLTELLSAQPEAKEEAKSIQELSDSIAIEIYDSILCGPNGSNESKIYQTKDLLTTNNFYQAQTNIPGSGWAKIFSLLIKNGYSVPKLELSPAQPAEQGEEKFYLYDEITNQLEEIASVDDAKNFIRENYIEGNSIHPDFSAFLILKEVGTVETIEENDEVKGIQIKLSNHNQQS